MKNSNVVRNVERIAEILKENPAVTHIYFRRDDEQLVDIPVNQAVQTAQREVYWRVMDGAVPALETVKAKREELPVILPAKPSEEKPLEVVITPPTDPKAPTVDQEGMSQLVAAPEIPPTTDASPIAPPPPAPNAKAKEEKPKAGKKKATK